MRGALLGPAPCRACHSIVVWTGWSWREIARDALGRAYPGPLHRCRP